MCAPPLILPEVGVRPMIGSVFILPVVAGSRRGPKYFSWARGMSRTGGLIPRPASRTGGLASLELDGHGAIDTQTLVGYVCMGVSKSVVDDRGV